MLPVVRALAEAGAAVSIDTMNASTALAAVEAGARHRQRRLGRPRRPRHARRDRAAPMPTLVLRALARTLCGHVRARRVRGRRRRGARELAERVDAAAAAGIPPGRLIVDPGIGFAKKGEQNWDVLRGLPRVIGLGHRVLVGTTRKRFLAEALCTDGSPRTRRSPSAPRPRDRGHERARRAGGRVGRARARRRRDQATRCASQRAGRGDDRWTSSTRSP